MISKIVSNKEILTGKIISENVIKDIKKFINSINNNSTNLPRKIN